MSFLDLLRIVVSPNTRRNQAVETAKISADIRKAAQEHSREIKLLKEALSTGPKLKMIVEPKRDRGGRFMRCESKAH